MEKFTIKTVEQQKKDYVRALRQSWGHQRNLIEDKHSFELERAQIMLKQASEIGQMIGPIHDRVANAADKEFGAETWRRDKKLLKLVSERMASRSALAQSRVDRLRQKATEARAPYDREFRRAKARFERFLRSAQ